jgi:hypothetical protein
MRVRNLDVSTPIRSRSARGGAEGLVSVAVFFFFAVPKPDGMERQERLFLELAEAITWTPGFSGDFATVTLAKSTRATLFMRRG